MLANERSHPYRSPRSVYLLPTLAQIRHYAQYSSFAGLKLMTHPNKKVSKISKKPARALCPLFAILFIVQRLGIFKRGLFLLLCLFGELIVADGK